MKMKYIVFVPLMSRIPWASLPSSVGRDHSQSVFRSGFFIRPLYSMALPVVPSVMAAAKYSLYAHLSIRRFLLVAA